MRWQIAVAPKPGFPDSLGHQVELRLRAAGIAAPGRVQTARLFSVEGGLRREDARRLADELFRDPVVDDAQVRGDGDAFPPLPGVVSVFRKPGVMDPAEAGIIRAAACLGIPLDSAATGTRYRFEDGDSGLLDRAALILANPAIEIVVRESDRFPPRPPMGAAPPGRREIPLLELDDSSLVRLSRDGGLSLSLAEMQAIQSHFRSLGREPTEIELETLAQTWSEHCKHKTMAGAIRYRGDPVPGMGPDFTTANLLRDTIKHATESLDRKFCLSVFHDNAGVIDFDGDLALCIKVETHNHPSAIEPYGGAGTGVGGVIRDILGTGRGAHPVANLDVFCVAPLDIDRVPPGAQHPLQILRGVVSGVRDYGNQMGIPTVSGAVYFDERYVGNPLVYCGTVGLLPKNCVSKRVTAGELIVAMGGRTGRDGIHGATFSSAELHDQSEVLDSGAVQIGNAITQKKMMDVLLQARDLGLYSAVTDCGAGGFSSAVGEMGEHCGARVHLDRAPLKYAGLSPAEVWISEAQERMVLAVPPGCIDRLLDLCAKEDVEAVVLGEFTGSGRLELFHRGELVGELGMDFLHNGLPRVTREAAFRLPASAAATAPPPGGGYGESLLRLLAHPNVASKEWIIRQYDHEVQGGSVVKPLVGTRAHGPSDGAVVAPVPGSTAGFALGLGLHPALGDLDPYAMAQAAVDEAVRNAVCLGGDPDHTAILDNFCWGNTEKPDRLGGLVRAAYGCRDAAIALRTPFVSGKDSLNNEFKSGDGTISIPPTLLVTAISRVPDVRRAVTMDFKAPGSAVFILGTGGGEMGGSLHARLEGWAATDIPPFRGEQALLLFRALHRAMHLRLVRACHDLSDGGLAVALAEMVLAGEVGVDLDLDEVPGAGPGIHDAALLFGEAPTRFAVEVPGDSKGEFLALFDGLPAAQAGVTIAEPRLKIRRRQDILIDLDHRRIEAAWRPPLTRAMDPEGAPSHA